MLALLNGNRVNLTPAQQVNSFYYSQLNNILSIKDRYDSTLASLPASEQAFVLTMITQACSEFKRNYPLVTKWSDLQLAQAVYVKLSEVHIDTTMQRLLDLHWVAKLLAKFKSTKVVPIQVYLDPENNKYCAWDGQHTIVLLYIIVTQILDVNPEDVMVPVNIYPTNMKAQMRECFLDLNSPAGKKGLDLVDHWQQHVCAVRIDGSQNPQWKITEKKQSILEKYDLFATHEKFYNDHLPGAISRLQELNKLDVETVEWLCEYFNRVLSVQQRPVVEKEMVMMAHYFYRCKLERIKVDSNYIAALAGVTMTLWNADFTPHGPFWDKVRNAYIAWHAASGQIGAVPKVSKEPVHGFPFLHAQLSKSLVGYPIPRNDSNSLFYPDPQDLF